MGNQLENLYYSIQEKLASSLDADRIALKHPGSKGEASENNWIELFNLYLPHRYQTHKAFVIDSNGDCSDQIDVVVYDRQYTPLLYNQHGHMYIPAESVYAVFEVKQDLTKDHIEYTGAKAKSVRKLHRTSAEIYHANGVYKPRSLFDIVSGILTYESGWTPSFGGPLIETLRQRPFDEKIDLGCVVTQGTFEVLYQDNVIAEISVSDKDYALIYFLFRLLDRLQKLGTVPAIDYSIYSQTLTKYVIN